ncbi:MAG TPA: hypothetical protein VMV54_07515 [Acidocella sp.]|nr:hypothetical protein [Acidocella sp.]
MIQLQLALRGVPCGKGEANIALAGSTFWSRSAPVDWHNRHQIERPGH